MQKLGLSQEISITNACKIEHLLDAEVIRRIAKIT
jgi:Mn-dependent DtxR family transcriptional regulator